jgi:hypothetical protein
LFASIRARPIQKCLLYLETESDLWWPKLTFRLRDKHLRPQPKAPHSLSVLLSAISAHQLLMNCPASSEWQRKQNKSSSLSTLHEIAELHSLRSSLLQATIRSWKIPYSRQHPDKFQSTACASVP